MDMGLSYRWNKPKYALVLNFDVQNIFNRLNVEERAFEPESGEILQFTQLGWIPIFNVRMEF